MKSLFVRGGAVAAALLLASLITPTAVAAPTPTPDHSSQSPRTTDQSTSSTIRPAAPKAAVVVTAVIPDFDDVGAKVRAYPPAGVVVEYQPADAEPESDPWSPLPTAGADGWSPMPTSETLRFRWRAEDPTTVEVQGPSSWVHTFPVRPADAGQQGDEFNEPGLNHQWQVSANNNAGGPVKGKSLFRPENLTVTDGNLEIRSARHCLPLGPGPEPDSDPVPTQEPSESNRTDRVCDAENERTAYTTGRIDTAFDLKTPRSMEVRARIDGENVDDDGHYGITSTAWSHNANPFCGRGPGQTPNSDMVEIDTMEIWKLGMSHNSTHLNCKDGTGKNIGDRVNKRIPGQWHTWRMEFDGYAFRYWLDGEVVLKKMPSKGLTAEVAGMSQEEFSHDVFAYPFKISMYTTANVTGSWAPFIDDAQRFETQTDRWDYVRWEEFDPKAPGCAPAGEIAKVAAATPGLGENWTCERDTEAMDAKVQDFTGGRVYTTPQGGAVALTGPMWDKFNALGGERALGSPIGQPRQVAGTTVQDFASGMLVDSGAGVHLVKGEIGKKWLTMPELLGAPISDELCGLRDGGCVQRFERETGHIYWSGATGAHFTRGRVQAKYGDMGWENSNIGYPITDEICGMRDGGCFQRFQGESGHIYWSPASDAHFVRGAIFSRYGSMGWETGAFGYPITDEKCGLRDGGCVQEFQGESGHIYWSPATGPWSVQGAIFSHYQRNAWEMGRFGYPVGSEQCRDVAGARECVQGFQRGRITWNSRSGLSG